MQPTESLMHLFFQSFSGREIDILSYHGNDHGKKGEALAFVRLC